MRKFALIALAAAGVTLLALFVGRLAPSSGNASSHREAPLISEDPTADTTDLYAFRSPDKPNTLTIVANWIPGEDPAAGPNYYTFSQADSAKYLIYIDRNGDGKPDHTWNFQFKTPDRAVLPRQHAADLDGEAQRRGVRERQDADQQHRPALQQLRRGEGLRVARAVHDRHEGRRLDLRRPARRSVLRRRRRDLRPRRDPQGGDDREQGRWQGLPVRLQRPHDRPADPDLAGRQRKSHTIGVWAATNRKNVTVHGHLYKGWTQVSRLGEPADQRGRHPDRAEGPLEPHDAAARLAVQEVLRDPDPRRRAEQALQARRPGDQARRPRRRARHRDPEGHVHRARPSRTSSGSTSRSPSRRTRTGWACSAATTRASRTAAG